MSTQSECPIKCTLTSDDPNVEEQVISFRKEQGKKSAYSLELPPITATITTKASSSSSSAYLSSSHSITAPAHCYIQCTDDSQVFFLGGFRMTSNSRTVEVYLDDGKKAGASTKPVYLTTTRGIPYKPEKDETTTTTTTAATAVRDESLYKIVCVIPGGARPIRQLYLKFLQLQPADTDTDTVRVTSLYLTARLPDETDRDASIRKQPSIPASLFAYTPGLQQMIASHPALAAAVAPHNLAAAASDSLSAAAAACPAQQHTSATQQPQTPPLPTTTNTAAAAAATPLTSDDLGAAMAGISFLMRSAQDAICDKIDKSTKKQQQQQTAMQQQQQQQQYIQGVQQQQLHQLTCLVAKQQETLQQQTSLLQQQGALLQQQGAQLESLRQEVARSRRNNTMNGDGAQPPLESTETPNEHCNAVVVVNDDDDDTNSVSKAKKVQDDDENDDKPIEKADTTATGSVSNNHCHTMENTYNGDHPSSQSVSEIRSCYFQMDCMYREE